MKNKIKNFFKILVVTAGCLMFASFSPSLDGRAVVVDDGVFPQGLFAKTVGYLPGDIISVTNIAGDATVDILVIGALDPSEGVAIMLSPEAAQAMGIDKGSNNIVKITKRSGQEDRVYGNAVISKSAADFEDNNDESFESIGAEVNSEAFEEPEPEEKTPVEEPAEETEEFTEPEETEEAFAEETEPAEEEPAEAPEDETEENFEEETIEEEAPVEEEPLEETEETFEEAVPEEEFEDEAVPEEAPVEEEPEAEPEETIAEEPLEEEPLEEQPEEKEYEAVEEENLPEAEETPAEEAFEDEVPEEETVEDEAPVEEAPVSEEAEPEVPEETVEEEAPAEEETPNEEAFEAEELDELPAEETPAEEEYTEEVPAAETVEEEYEAIVLVPADSNPPEAVEEEKEEAVEETIEDAVDTDEVEDLVAENELDEINDEVFNLTPVESETPAAEVEEVKPVEEVPETAPVSASTSYDKYVVPSLKDLESGKYYIQIAVYGSDENILEIINKYGNNYPITIVPMAGGKNKQILVGPVTMDEYKVVLERFKSYGFKDAFLRKIK